MEVKADSQQPEPVPESEKCPECGQRIVHQEGIKVCHSCGWQSAPC